MQTFGSSLDVGRSRECDVGHAGRVRPRLGCRKRHMRVIAAVRKAASMIEVYFAALALLLLVLHLVSVTLAWPGCRRSQRPIATSADAPTVSIVRPVCGAENYLEETLRSGFLLDYWSYELIFCIEDGDDAAVPIVRRLMAQHSCVPARLLVGRDTVSDNPKLNNIDKGWRAASGTWVIMADSNVLMPPDYVQRLASAWTSDAGLACSPPIGTSPRNLAAELECGFLNTYQARWQYAAIGSGFHSHRASRCSGGKRILIAGAGCMRSRPNSPRMPPRQKWCGTQVVACVSPRRPLPNRSDDADCAKFGSAKCGGRDCVATPSRFTSRSRSRPAAWPVGVLLWRRPAHSTLFAAVAYPAIWYGAEALVARSAGWPLSWRSPFLWVARDVMLPAIWVSAWTGSRFVWRGNAMQVAQRTAPAQ